jgi:ATP-binding cassette subfamily B protein
MLNALRKRAEWKFFAVLPRADARLAMVGAVQRGESLTVPLAVVGVVFVLLQVLAPVHQAISADLGSRVAAWLYDRLTEACVKPPGMGHLEDPELTSDLTVAREFDAGMTGPPMHMNLDFIAGGLVTAVTGVACAAVLLGFAWWVPLVLGGAWTFTHWLLRESAVWQDRNTAEVREAQRHAEYAYRLAVDPPAAKELRLFGLQDWVMERFVSRRTQLHSLQYRATRLREKPLAWSLLVVLAANAVVFWALASAAFSGRIDLGGVVAYAQVAVGVSAIAFGGLSWALDGAAAPVAAVLKLEAAMGARGALAVPAVPAPASGLPAPEIRFQNVTFAYPGSARPVLDGFDLTLPAGSSLAIVGQNGAGKTTLAKLLCRLYDPQRGAILADGVDLRELDVDSWRSRLTAVFQDFTRFELPLRDNVAPFGAPDDVIRAALTEAGASGLARLDTPLARGYDDGTELSGGQWQRVALARALHPRRHPECHHDPDLAPLLDGPAGRPDLRARARPGDRARDARRAHGPGRPLPHDVRLAGTALLSRRGRGRGRLCPARLSGCRPRSPRCGGC